MSSYEAWIGNPYMQCETACHPLEHRSWHMSSLKYSDSNTSWTPGEPSEVPLGTSTTTSAIKIGEVTIFFSAFGRNPPLPPLVWDPRSATPLDVLGRFMPSFLPTFKCPAVNYPEQNGDEPRFVVLSKKCYVHCQRRRVEIWKVPFGPCHKLVMPTPDGRVSGLWSGRVSQRNRGFAISLYPFLRERGFRNSFIQ
jgi:hypothetical protein